MASLLAYHALAKLLLHVKELFALAFQHPVHGNPGPARDDPGNLLCRDLLLEHLALGRRFRQFPFEPRDDRIEQLAGALEITAPLRGFELVARLVELLLQALNRAELFLLGAPARGELRRAPLKFTDLLFDLLETLLGGRIGLLLQRFAFDLELDDPAIELVERFRLRIDFHPQAARRLVDQIDGLVGQMPVGDVAGRERGCRDNGAVGDAHAVMELVFLLEPAQDRDRFLHRRLVDEYRLEAPSERGILFDVLAVFIERGRADAVQLAAGKRRLEHVRGIHRPFGFAGADQRVQLVDEQDDVAGSRDLLQHRLEPLLEFAAVFGAGEQRAEIERQQAPAFEGLGYVPLDDALRQPLDDRGLSDAGFADQDRIILGAAREHLDGAADFLVATDDRIELVLPRLLGEVAGVLLERLVALLGRGTVGFASLANVLDRLSEALRGDAVAA